MATKADPARRSFYWFIVDGHIQWDQQGWELNFRTPLLGFLLTQCFTDIQRSEEVRVNRIHLGLLCRWPSHEGDLLYRFNWEKKWAPRSVTPPTPA